MQRDKGTGRSSLKQPGSKTTAGSQPPSGMPSTSRLSAIRSSASKRTPASKPPVKCKGIKEPPPPPPQIPAFSLALPPPTMEEEHKQKQKIMRRNKPQGEDLKKIKEIMRGIVNKPLTVHEFIGLVAPSTGDNGELLRSVLADELAQFRVTSRKIYETMTQDISDVLTNEHIQLKEYSEERHALYVEKLQRNINEIFSLCPDFSFDRFFTEDHYLEEAFPKSPELDMEPDELEARMRQEAYHRYQWLKSEGERLKEENVRLQKRLNQLKKQQKEELRVVAEREQRAEEERQKLEDQQEQLEEKLDELNVSVEKQLVESELEQEDAVDLAPLPPKPKVTDKFKTPPRRKSDWAADQAAEIEASKTSEALAAETSKLSLRSKLSKSTVKKKPKRKPIRPPPSEQQQPGETSPFHFSPLKTPPRGDSEAPQQKSPFHYSPLKTPPPAASASAQPASPFHYSPMKTPPPSGMPPPSQASPHRPDFAPVGDEAADVGGEAQPQRVRITRSTTVTQQEPPTPQGHQQRDQQPSARRGRYQAPRDSWGGFY